MWKCAYSKHIGVGHSDYRFIGDYQMIYSVSYLAKNSII